jgi:hypothetical protein
MTVLGFHSLFRYSACVKCLSNSFDLQIDISKTSFLKDPSIITEQMCRSQKVDGGNLVRPTLSRNEGVDNELN